MYDFYPEWGPSRHRDDSPTTPTRRARYWQQGSQPAFAMAGRAEARDDDRDRPDDN